MADLQKSRIRNIIDGVYDMQKLRIATGNRIVASMRPEVVASQNEKSKMSTADKDKKSKEQEQLLKKITAEYDKITDYYVDVCKGKGSIDKAIAKMDTPTDYIKSKVDYILVQNYERLVESETSLTKAVETIVKEHPLWDAFFEDVKGCGPMMAAICIAYLDPYKAKYSSSFQKYCGLDVVINEDGEGEGRSKRHTEMRQYIDKDGNVAERKSLTYNPFVKSKLLGVLAGSFLKAGDNHYSRIYYDYKHRLQNHPKHKDKLPIVHHRMAARYCIKAFLRDLWVAWRTLEGLEVTEPYEVAKLGMKPHGAA